MTLQEQVQLALQRKREALAAMTEDARRGEYERILEDMQRRAGVPLRYAGEQTFPVIDGVIGGTRRIIRQVYPLVWVDADYQAAIDAKQSLAAIDECPRHGKYVHRTFFTAKITQVTGDPREQMAAAIADALAVGSLCPICRLEQDLHACPTCGSDLLAS